MTWSVPDIGHYALIDKLILGIMDNLQSMSNRTAINPCLTSAPGIDSLTEDDYAPDMAHKPEPPRNRTGQEHDHTPPDMVNKPGKGHHHHHLHGSSGGAGEPSPPDMAEKAKSPAPDLDTSTITTSDNEEEVQTDSSDVKCGCSCSCSRVKGRRIGGNNATMTAAG